MSINAAVITEAFGSATPLEESIWPRDLATSWNLKSMLKQSITLTDPEQVKAAIVIAVTLLEFDFHLIERCIERVGVTRALRILEQTKARFISGGSSPSPADEDLVVVDTGRRRTPGGVYMRFLKADAETTADDKKYIFKDNTRRQQKLRRDLARVDRVHAAVTGAAKDDELEAIESICVRLAMSEISIVERIIFLQGEKFAHDLADEAVKIEKDGGLKTSDGQRRRTPGGVFAQLIKDSDKLSLDNKRFIFAVATGGNSSRPQSSKKRRSPTASFIEPNPKRQTSDSSPAVHAESIDRHTPLITASEPGSWAARAAAAAAKGKAPRVSTNPSFLGDEDYSKAPAVLSSGAPQTDIVMISQPSPTGAFTSFVSSTDPAEAEKNIHFNLLPENENDSRRRIVAEIACGLGVEKSRVHVMFMERVVYKLGTDLALDLYLQTQKEERETGGKIGGILTNLLRTDSRVNQKDVDWIYELHTDADSTTSSSNDNSEICSIRVAVAEMAAIQAMTVGLKLRETTLIERVVFKFGEQLASTVYNEVQTIEANGGKSVDSGERRFTPGALFVQILKQKISNEDLSFVLDRGVLAKTLANAKPTLPNNTRLFNSEDLRSKIAEEIVVELERLKMTETDLMVFALSLQICGTEWCRYAYEKTRKIAAKSPHHSPGEIFAAVLKKKRSNNELNTIFAPARDLQNFKNMKSNSAVDPSNNMTPFAFNSLCTDAASLGLSVSLLGFSAAGLSVVERVVERLGVDTAQHALERTKEIEAEGGYMTRDGQRRKTPAGTFLSVLKYENKVSNELMRYFFSDINKHKDRKHEDAHYAPSVFTPMNPFAVVDSSGKDQTFIDKIKKVLHPVLQQLQYISTVDPRLPSIIRGAVFLGPTSVGVLERCVHLLGEEKVEKALEQLASDNAASYDSSVSKTNPPESFRQFRAMIRADRSITDKQREFIFDIASKIQMPVIEKDGWTEVVNKTKLKKQEHSQSRPNRPFRRNDSKDLKENNPPVDNKDNNKLENRSRDFKDNRPAGFTDPTEVVKRLTLVRDARSQTVSKIVLGLKAFDVTVAERLVFKVGEALALDLYRQALDIQANGGVATDDGLRKKFPAGVFIKVLKESKSLSIDDKAFIFQEGKNRSDIRRSVQDAKKATRTVA